MAEDPIVQAFANIINTFANPIVLITFLILFILGLLFPKDSPFPKRYTVQVIGAPIFGLFGLLRQASVKIILMGVILLAATAIILLVVVIIYGFAVAIVTGSGDFNSGIDQILSWWDQLGW